jgi:2-polyprenyl-6-methoxyphenol hydroxylase-like FAD-dependent oxidoreductase
MMLAAELSPVGVDAAVVERRSSQALVGSRAGDLHSRTIEILDTRGIADRFLTAQMGGFAGMPPGISDFPTWHSCGLALWKNRIEVILTARVRELGVRTVSATEVTGVTRDLSRLDASLSTGSNLRAQSLARCDE